MAVIVQSTENLMALSTMCSIAVNSRLQSIPVSMSRPMNLEILKIKVLHNVHWFISSKDHTVAGDFTIKLSRPVHGRGLDSNSQEELLQSKWAAFQHIFTFLHMSNIGSNVCPTLILKMDLDFCNILELINNKHKHFDISNNSNDNKYGTVLKGAIRDFYNLLSVAQTLFNTYTEVARAQSYAKHMQHKCLSHATYV